MQGVDMKAYFGCYPIGPVLARTVATLLLLVLTGCSDSSGNHNADGGATADTPDVTVASLNVLHGLSCPSETQACRVADRQDLLFDWLESIDCPDVVLLQEILGEHIYALLQERAAVRCGGVYQVLSPTFNQNITLTKYPVLQTGEDTLVGRVRTLFYTQIDHPTGVVDVFNTHLGAGVDVRPCDDNCPQECLAAGAADTRECQAIQVARLIQERAAPGSLRILGGDFNADPQSFVYRHLVGANGWTDAYLAAGNPECDPSTGTGCTSGRQDEDLSEMESSASGETKRIDYLFLQLPAPGTGACQYALDSRRDDDGDGFATRIFADDPNPFAETCGPLPDAICWPSDHEGSQADINCI